LGFELHAAADLQAARNMVKTRYYRLAIMNFRTLEKQIYKFVSSLRSSSTETIIIILMAQPRIRIEARLFDCGANDVVVAAHSRGRLLTKRIAAHMRNSAAFWSSGRIVGLKNTVINFDRQEVWCKGVIHPLTGILLPLLRYFLNNPGRVISRDELAQCPIWADSICSAAQDGGKTFDVNIGKLRKIVEPDPANPRIIEAVRGVGWKLADDVIVEEALNGPYTGMSEK
jgi:two-component system phosphate regulon response regulator OmpR